MLSKLAEDRLLRKAELGKIAEADDEEADDEFEGSSSDDGGLVITNDHKSTTSTCLPV